METANYMQVVSYPNGFVVVEKGAIDDDTKAKIEGQGYMVIEKRPGRHVEVYYSPRPTVHYHNSQPFGGQAIQGGPYIQGMP